MHNSFVTNEDLFMNNVFKVALLFTVSLFCMNAYSTTYVFNSGAMMEAELPPNEPQIFLNFLLWKVRGVCEVISDVQQNPLSFTMLTNKGTLNGVDFSEGSSLYFVAEAGQQFQLAAEPRAKVEIINHGLTTIKMKCSSN